MEVGEKYLAIEFLNNRIIGYKIARIIQINERYIWAEICERYIQQKFKFSRMTKKQYRPNSLKQYKLITKWEVNEIENMLGVRSINPEQYN